MGESEHQLLVKSHVIRPDWRACLLGDVVELKRGYDLPHSDRRQGTIPIISSSGHSGSHDEAKAAAPGVVTGRYGTIDEVFYVQEDFWPLNTSLYVRDFKSNDLRFISYFLRKWRGEPKPDLWDDVGHGAWKYEDVPGFCKATNIDRIRTHGFVFTPGRYVGIDEQEEGDEPFEEKFPRLLAELEECFDKGERLTEHVREQLQGAHG